MFGDYDKATALLDKHYNIAKNWQSVGALDGYNGLYGMVYVMQGNPTKALEYFDDRIDPGNYQYYSYFKALALKATQKEEEAKDKPMTNVKNVLIQILSKPRKYVKPWGRRHEALTYVQISSLTKLCL